MKKNSTLFFSCYFRSHSQQQNKLKVTMKVCQVQILNIILSKFLQTYEILNSKMHLTENKKHTYQYHIKYSQWFLNSSLCALKNTHFTNWQTSIKQPHAQLHYLTNNIEIASDCLLKLPRSRTQMKYNKLHIHNTDENSNYSQQKQCKHACKIQTTRIQRDNPSK